MSSHRQTRLTVLLDDYFIAVALALAIITAGGAWMTYTTAIEPGTHIEQREVLSWSANGSFNYSATAVEDSPVFNRGDVRVKRRFYITNATPKFNGRFKFEFDGATGNTTVTTRATLINYAVPKNKSKDEKKVDYSFYKMPNKRIWEISTPLTTDRQRVTSKGTATTNFTVDADSIRDLKRRLTKRHKSLYSVANIQSVVNVTTWVNGTIGGKRVQRVFTYTLPISGTQDYYVINPPRKPQQQFTYTRPVRVPTEPSMLSIGGSIASLVVPLGALVALVYGRKDGWFDVPETARDEAKRAKLRSEFDAWVTSGTVPAANGRTNITVDSLEGLVDVAIDSDKRAIEDDETGTYVVLDADTRYQFTPEWTVNGNGHGVEKQASGKLKTRKERAIEETEKTEAAIEEATHEKGEENETTEDETTERETIEDWATEEETTRREATEEKGAEYKQRANGALHRFTDTLIMHLPPSSRVRALGTFRDDRVTTLRKSGVPSDDIIEYVEEDYDLDRIIDLLERGISPQNLKQYLEEANKPKLEEADEPERAEKSAEVEPNVEGAEVKKDAEVEPNEEESEVKKDAEAEEQEDVTPSSDN
jgi:hypothetical protein